MSDKNKEIESLLKNFSRIANERIREYLERLPADQNLRLRCVLEDVTEYKQPPVEELRVEIESEIHPGD